MPNWNSDSDRFWSKVDTSGDHWIWLGSTGRRGQGTFHIREDGRDVSHQAHRVSYALENGPIPSGYDIDHICRVTACVRPDHLRIATRKQNCENKSTLSKTAVSGVRGVNRTSKGKWCARVGHNGKTVNIGTYGTIEEAAAAVLAKRLELHTYNHEDRIAV